MMRLDDVFTRIPISQVAVEPSLYTSALWGSGAIAADADMAAKVGANDGRVFQSRYHKDLANPDDDSNPATGNGPVYGDDSDTAAPTFKIQSSFYDQVKTAPVMVWAEKDVVRLTGFLDDPLAVINGLVGGYWGRYLDMYAVAIAEGVKADNIANNSGDMVNNIGNAANPPDSANTISPEAIIDAIATSGDRMEDFTAMVVHSKVKAQLMKQNLVDTIPNTDDNTMFSYYQHMRLLTSDEYGLDTAGANPLATTVFFGPGAMGYGNSTNGIVSTELYRAPLQGRGAGDTSLISRVQFSMHPYGLSWTDASVTGSTADTSGDPLWPNLADNRNPVNWTRSASTRKHVKLAYLISNV